MSFEYIKVIKSNINTLQLYYMSSVIQDDVSLKIDKRNSKIDCIIDNVEESDDMTNDSTWPSYIYQEEDIKELKMTLFSINVSISGKSCYSSDTKYATWLQELEKIAISNSKALLKDELVNLNIVLGNITLKHHYYPLDRDEFISNIISHKLLLANRAIVKNGRMGNADVAFVGTDVYKYLKLEICESGNKRKLHGFDIIKTSHIDKDSVVLYRSSINKGVRNDPGLVILESESDNRYWEVFSLGTDYCMGFKVN